MGLSDILKSMFGNKSTRDLKKLTPIVNQIKAIYPEIDALDIDSLRQRTADIRQQLNDSVQDKRDEIDRYCDDVRTCLRCGRRTVVKSKRTVLLRHIPIGGWRSFIEVEVVQMECPHCGKTINALSRYCPACGRKLSEEPGQQE